MPFAGHPTLGTCHAWLQSGGKPKAAYVVQECGIGLVRVRRDGERLAFAAPPLRRSGPVAAEERASVLGALRLAPDAVRDMQWVENGPPWIGVLLHDAQAEQLLPLTPGADPNPNPDPQGTRRSAITELALSLRTLIAAVRFDRPDPVDRRRAGGF